MASFSRAVSKKKGVVWRAQVAIKGNRMSASFRTRREALAWAGRMETKISAEVESRRELQEKVGGCVARAADVGHDEILNNRIKNHCAPGIYLLFNDDVVSYVGQSRNVMKRIAGHASNGRAFTSYYVIPCHTDDLDTKERHFITLLNPPENKTLFGR